MSKKNDLLTCSQARSLQTANSDAWHHAGRGRPVNLSIAMHRACLLKSFEVLAEWRAGQGLPAAQLIQNFPLQLEGRRIGD